VIRDVATSRYPRLGPVALHRLHRRDLCGEGPRHRAPAAAGPARRVRPRRAAAGRPGGRDAGRRARRGVDPARRYPRAPSPTSRSRWTPPAAGSAERVADLAGHAPWPDRGRLRYTGAADGLVRLLTELATRVDGVRLHPLVLDEDLAVLSQLVLPALLRARTIARPVPGASLRTTFGLARPANRFATAGGVR